VSRKDVRVTRKNEGSLRKSVLAPHDDDRSQRSSALELGHGERVDRFDAVQPQDDVRRLRTDESATAEHDSRLQNARSVRPIARVQAQRVVPETKNVLSLDQKNEEVTPHVESVLKKTRSQDRKNGFQRHEANKPSSIVAAASASRSSRRCPSSTRSRRVLRAQDLSAALERRRNACS
jgi:hypothetical protein